MIRIILPTRRFALALLRPRGRSFVDAAFGGAHADYATFPTDPDPASDAVSTSGRLRPQRRDLLAALRADQTGPDQELTTWPPAARVEPCRGC